MMLHDCWDYWEEIGKETEQSLKIYFTNTTHWIWPFKKHIYDSNYEPMSYDILFPFILCIQTLQIDLSSRCLRCKDPVRSSGNEHFNYGPITIMLLYSVDKLKLFIW